MKTKLILIGIIAAFSACSHPIGVQPVSPVSSTTHKMVVMFGADSINISAQSYYSINGVKRFFSASAFTYHPGPGKGDYYSNDTIIVKDGDAMQFYLYEHNYDHHTGIIGIQLRITYPTPGWSGHLIGFTTDSVYTANWTVN